MDDIQESSEPGSPPYSPRMNNACLLNDSDLLFEDRGHSHEFATLVPENPSLLTHRRKRHSQKDDDRNVSTSSCSAKWEGQEHILGYLSTTPSSQRTMKRRRLEDSSASTLRGHSTVTPVANRFVTASSLLSSDFTWLESPRPATSCASRVSASSKPSSSAGSFTCALDQSSDPGYLNELLVTGHTSKQKTLNTSNGREQRSKKTIYRKTKSKSSKSTSAHTPFHAIEYDASLLDAAKRMQEPVRSPVCQIPEDFVLIEDDADDAVESMVRSVQMAEDEAYAKSLQEQFDMEERMEQQRLQSRSSNRDNHMVDPYVGLGWISPWASMINSASFSHGSSELSELQQVIFGEQPRRQQGRRQTDRTRNSRRRQASRLQMDLFDDSQGNNYEALLAFEEQQGAVAAKNTLTKAEIERLPVKKYDPAHSAGKTDCQICFSAYNAGERLRILPCLHDYHVKCIDRWLKENATCPICRADTSECGGFS
uniref:Si:ch211-59o9.10 n=1 Tax=Cyprinus carpio TaxID=7962 RepID=A0A8C2EET3_CYPCA